MPDTRRSNSPLVTIGLNVFNAADTVTTALESALAQDWQPTEIVVVDDGSTDGTQDILRSYAAAHPRIRLFLSSENRGLGAARNRVIEEARGEFIALFDDDDVSAPDRVTRQVRRILDYERDFAGGAHVTCHVARRQLYPDGGSRIEPTMGENEGKAAPAGPAVARRVLIGTPLADAYGSCAGCSQMARTSTFRELGGFDPFFRRCQDTELFIRMARAGAHFVGIAEPLVVQQMTPTSDKSLERVHAFRLAVIDKHRDFFDSEAQYRFARAWLGMKHAWHRQARGAFVGRLLSLGVRHPVMTSRRLAAATWNVEGNRAYRRFHQGAS